MCVIIPPLPPPARIREAFAITIFWMLRYLCWKKRSLSEAEEADSRMAALSHLISIGGGGLRLQTDWGRRSDEKTASRRKMMLGNGQPLCL